MVNHKFVSVDDYAAKLGDCEFWITNYPFAAFRLYGLSVNNYKRPSRLTILRAKRKLDKDLNG